MARSTAFSIERSMTPPCEAFTAPSVSWAGWRSPGPGNTAEQTSRRCTSSSSGTRWPMRVRLGPRSRRASSPRRSSSTVRPSRRSASCPTSGLGRCSSPSATPSRKPDRTWLRSRTCAVREGDEYVVDGEKRWTSGGHRADYLWMLCRTGSLESHSRGLSLLIVDRHSPGISVSPIAQVDGERFNEIRFEEVRVPVANRVGEENGAWPLMVESLATERHVQWCPKTRVARLRGSRRLGTGLPPRR